MNTLDQQTQPKDKATILIVEDVEVVRLVSFTQIETLNCYCEMAASGEEALTLYGKADLVLLDLNLPDMSGFEVCRRIRQHLTHDQLPIIALTSSTGKATEIQCQKADMQHFLAKPASLEDLYRTFFCWLPNYQLVIRRVVSGDEY